MTKPRLTVLTSTITLSFVSMLALVGCSATSDDTESLVSAEPLTSTTAAPAGNAPKPRDPAQLIQRFDANKNGKLETSELPARAQQRWGRADTNSDGVVTKEEIQAGMAKRHAERFAKTDSNGDGQLTESEVGAFRWNHMKGADANSDGKVSREEFDGARANGALGPRGGGRHWGKGGPNDRGPGDRGPRGMGKPGERPLQRFDANKDGKLDKSEVPEFVWERLGVADANSDGAVTQDEIDAAHANGTLKPRAKQDRGRGMRGASQSTRQSAR